MNTSVLFGERSLTLVAGAFSQCSEAEQAARNLRTTLPRAGQVMIVAPGDTDSERKFEPEQAGVFGTALRSHAILGLAGVVTGVLLAVSLAALGWSSIRASLGYAALFFGTLGGFLGLMAAGFLTLRPDHGVVIGKLNSQMKRGRWLVVVHPSSEVDAVAARQLLEVSGGETRRSL
jgi:hypothetical protein